MNPWRDLTPLKRTVALPVVILLLPSRPMISADEPRTVNIEPASVGRVSTAPAQPATTALSEMGASVPYVRYKTESGVLTGTASIVGPNRTVGDPAGEASGRKAVKLANSGDSVEWTATEDANSIVIRYCIPDNADGNGLDATINLYVNGEKRDAINLTSKYAWLYGPEGDPKNTPAFGSPRHIYDESHKLFNFTVKKGDKVILKKDSDNTAEYYYINFIELEMVGAPNPCPEGFVNLADEGITPENFSSKIASLIQNFEWKTGYKEKKGLYIPPGRYPMATKALINDKIADGFEIRGAGMWHTVLYDDSGAEADRGIPGFNLNGKSVKFSDFAVFGSGRNRNGSGKPFFNSYGDGTVMRRIWIEHMTCGFWVGGDRGVTKNLTIDSCRLRDLGADGINLCNGTKDSTVINTTVRSSGDDGIAIWSAPEMDGAAGGIDYAGCANNLIKNCTVELQWRANAYAIYGGKDNTIENCIARDTLTYAGVNISSTFKPRPFAGTTLVNHVLLERCGGSFWSGQQFGALWVMADDSVASGIVFKNIEIIDPTYSGIMLKSETYQKSAPEMNVSFENVNIVNPGTCGIFIVDAMGTANFKNTKLTNASPKPVLRSKNNNGKTGTGEIQLITDSRCSGFKE